MSLTTLAAAALGIGVTSSSRSAEDFLVAAGLTGASGLALGTWFSSTPRQRVWIAGIKALNCAVTAMEPLSIASVNLSGKLDQLSTTIQSTHAQSARVQGSIAEIVAISGQDTPLVAAARAQVQMSIGATSNADDAYAEATKLQLAVSRAGPALENAVDRIAAVVDDAILSTQTELSGLPGIISNLAAGGAQFVQLPEPGQFPQITREVRESNEIEEDRDTSAIVSAEVTLRDELAVLAGTVASMRSATSRVAAIVNAVNQKLPFDALKNCGVSIKAPVTALKIQPSGVIEFMQGKAGNRGFTISGGDDPYSAQLLDEVDGLTVKQPVAFGPTVTVAANDKVEPGTYNIQISDVLKNSLIIRVTIVPKPTETKVINEGGDSAEDGDPVVTKIQKHLKLVGFDPGPIDGNRGLANSRSNAAIRALLSKINHEEKDPTKLSDESITNLLDELLAKIGGNKNPKGLDIYLIEHELVALGHSPGTVDGVVEEETTMAIESAGITYSVDLNNEDSRARVLMDLRRKLSGN